MQKINFTLGLFLILSHFNIFCQEVQYVDFEKKIEQIFSVNKEDYSEIGVVAINFVGVGVDDFLKCEVSIKLRKNIDSFIRISYPRSFRLEQSRSFKNNDNFYFINSLSNVFYSTSRNSCDRENGDCWQYDYGELYFEQRGSTWKNKFEIGFSRDDKRGRCLIDPIFGRVK